MADSVFGSGIKKKRPHRYLCGVPSERCVGSMTGASGGLHKGCKMHGSPVEAFKCHAKYLVSQGFAQVGPREFASPNNGPVRVLTKKSRFGARARGGKGDRFMPEQQVGGVVISC